jgi:hypothetical protein
LSGDFPGPKMTVPSGTVTTAASRISVSFTDASSCESPSNFAIQSVVIPLTPFDPAPTERHISFGAPKRCA